MNYNLNIDIEELILDGFSSHQQNGISHAIKNELTRLFTENGIPESLKRNNQVQKVNPGIIDVKANQRSEMIGSQVAQRIYYSLNNG